MPSINIILPWFFEFFREIASLGKYELSNLLYGDPANGYYYIQEVQDLSSGSARAYHSHKVDLSALNHLSTFFWLCQNQTIKNPESKPKGLFANFWGSYKSEWNELFIIACIKIKNDQLAEVTVYGEKYFAELKDFFAKLKSAEGKEIKLELRQVNEVTSQNW